MALEVVKKGTKTMHPQPAREMRVTLGKNQVWYINTAAFRALGCPSYVLVLYDAETGKAAIRTLREYEPEMYGYSVTKTEASTSAYFCCRSLARAMAPDGEKRSFIATYTEDDMLLFGGTEGA